MDTDPIIDEIREVRHRISERFGRDPKRLIEHYMELQEKKYGDRLLRPKELPSRIEDVRTGPGGSPEAHTSLEWLVGYYHLERYLFEVVHRRFHTEHSVGDFDFFSIVVWKGYRDYIDAVNSAIPGPLSLRDKDRCLWARSAAAQLREDIKSRFTGSPD